MNKNYLLDTHVFIWWIEGNSRIDKKVKSLIENSKGEVFISMASIWEMAIKISIGKLKLKNSIDKTINKARFEVLNISLSHALQIIKLPLIHKDPFDRMLVAQAIAENMTLITDDPKVGKYKVKLLK